MRGIIIATVAMLAIAVIGLLLYLVLRDPAVHDAAGDLKQDVKQLGHDAVDGVKDAGKATRDAMP